jgi:hypothetical protein
MIADEKTYYLFDGGLYFISAVAIVYTFLYKFLHLLFHILSSS